MMSRRSGNWINHALRRARWQPQRQVVALGTLGFFIALILGALYLSQIASEVTINRQLSALLLERDELEHTNERLRQEIAENIAVPNLQARAEALGFSIATSARGQIEYLPVRGYNPARAETVAPIVVDDDTTAIYDETFTGWLQEQWDLLRASFGNLIRGG